ncbi:glycerophosphodiester phosphodiesterase [Seongchinamella sediminis]|uniref:glycerophosphodiester phosphodiesterase n=1 Tax=Seongchinamella sediminis TaxID=2283635 RepID=A0A3L7E3L9_9GAMM|nr:glycerophosphodiester phosphodiesterase [Seongchinamella sediminis]RLQ23450.1 glycerophosphodiester phosphodiesterase [Seongchinamella sediminis]
MPPHRHGALQALLALSISLVAAVTGAQPIVIAHRGASGYLPEHSLEAKAMAHAMGADFIEQDVVLTRDGVPIVLHDIHLESTTDVEQRFPDRSRQDGRFYALDFDLAEIRDLRLHERSYRDDSGQVRAYFPDRFPLGQGTFTLPTLEEEIQLIAGLDHSRGTTTGLYIELKAPAWHATQGRDLAAAVLDVLARTGYHDKPEQVFLQCFHEPTLVALKSRTSLPLIQLIGENDWGEDGAIDYDAMRTPEGIARVATYASGIGPWIPQVVRSGERGLEATGLAALARRHSLLVHPYTLRSDQLPEGVTHPDQLHQALFQQAGVDGLFTDFPDLTRAYLDGLR